MLMAFLCIALLFCGKHTGNERWQTRVFTLLTFCQLAHVLAIRSERDSLFAQGLWSNRWLTLTLAFTVLLQLAVIYLSFCNCIFKTLPLTLPELVAFFALSAIVCVAAEIQE